VIAVFVLAAFGVLWWWTDDDRAIARINASAEEVFGELKPSGAVQDLTHHSEGLRATLTYPDGFSLSDLSVPTGFAPWDLGEYESGPYRTVGFTRGRLPSSDTDCVTFIRIPHENLGRRDRAIVDVFC